MASKRNKEPDTLAYKSTVFDFAFHPSQDIIATGLITGHINCVKYAPGKGNNEVMWSTRPSKKSVRGLAFSHDGAGLFTVTKDGSIGALDVNTGNVLIKKPDAHEAPINAVRLLTETVLATGDDNGVIKLWDVRTGNETMEYTDNSDFISDMDYDPASKTLVASSGQGTVSVFDIRKPKMLDMSATQDDELLSICIIKDRRKVLAGSQEGILNIYSWGDWGDCTDRFLGHPNSIDTICKIDEDTVVTGSSDGLIRVIDILPNKFQGIVGEHENYPIECLRLSHDRTFLASSSHDDTVRFWDIRYLTTERGDGDEDDDSEEAKEETGDKDDDEEEDEEDDKDDDKDEEDDEDDDDSDNSDDSDEEKDEEDEKGLEKKPTGAASSSSSSSKPTAGSKRKEMNDSSDDDSDQASKKKNANANRRPKKAAPPKEDPNFFDDL
ncbi:WD domain repeat-containing protein 55 [Actinomortierella ambigua]|uniref:WD repeat-containing protein JIP5 n=1 Tax=Actinomortierella ambigua TaxID=1343610 RepID=A0A9P6QG39_9FUNG|nr:WD domain repeat-containing protein 55 [Actinomortierella ambigua]